MTRGRTLECCIFIGLLSAALAGEPSEPVPRSFAYVLQAERLGKSREEAVQRLANCGRDWIILDAFFEPGEGGAYSAKEISQIKTARAHRKVLAYLSIGEAENYRPCWRREWDANRDGHPDARAPSWLLAENPDWKGNYRVRYWDTNWQNIVVGLLDQIIQSGFDGVYLDVVDAFENFEYDAIRRDWMDNRPNPQTGQSYRQDMICWVSRLSEHARRQKPDFLIIPQNGAQMLENPEFLSTIDGMGVEDLFTDGHRQQKPEHIQNTVGFLERLKAVGKPVLVIEYAARQPLVRGAVQEARKHGYVLLVTDRELRTLGQSGIFGERE